MSSVGSEAVRPRRGGAAVDVYLSAEQVAMEHADGTLWVRTVVDRADGLAALASELAARAKASRVKRLRLWLGASLCRPVRLAAMPGALNAGERLLVGEAAALAEAGLPAPVRVWIDAADAAGCRLAVVVEEATLDALEALATTLRARLVSVRPWWAAVLAAALDERPSIQALAVFEGGALTLLIGDGDGAETIRVARTTTKVRDVAAANAASLRATIAEGVEPEWMLALGLDLREAATSPQGGTPTAVPQGLPFGAWVTTLEPRP